MVRQAGPKRGRLHPERHRPQGGARASRQTSARPGRVDGIPNDPAWSAKSAPHTSERSLEPIINLVLEIQYESHGNRNPKAAHARAAADVSPERSSCYPKTLCGWQDGAILASR